MDKLIRQSTEDVTSGGEMREMGIENDRILSNDYFYVIKTLLEQPQKTDVKGIQALKSVLYDQSRVVFSLRMDSSPIEKHDEDLGISRECDLIIDPRIVEYVKENQSVCAERLPLLYEYVRRFIQNETQAVLKKFFSGKEKITMGEMVLAESVSSDFFEDDKNGLQMEALVNKFGPNFISAIAKIKGEKLNKLEDFDYCLPEEARVLIENELSLEERINLQIMLAKSANETLVAGKKVDMWEVYNNKFNPWLNAVSLNNEGEDFISNHSEIFTADFFSKITGFEKSKFTQEVIDAIVVGHINEATLKKYLISKGFNGPVSVIPDYRGYRSCPATEEKLQKEMDSRQALVVSMDFEDGTQTLMAVKFNEVVLGVCLESSNPSFMPGVSYRPIKGTYRDLQYKYQPPFINLKFPKSYQPLHVWAVNRPTTYSEYELANLLLIAKKIEDDHKDRSVQVDESVVI